MSFNKLYLLPALLFSTFLLNSIEAHPSPQELDPSQGGKTPAHDGAYRTHNGAHRTHIHHTGGPTKIHTHKIETQGVDSEKEMETQTTIVNTGDKSSVNTVSMDNVETQTTIVNTGDKSSVNTVPMDNGLNCQKGFVNGITSKVRDVLNGGAHKLEHIVNHLTRNGTLLGPVGGLVNVLGEGLDDLFENGVSGLKYGIDDIACALKGVEKAVKEVISTGNLGGGVTDLGKNVLTEAKALVKDLVKYAKAGVGGTVHDVGGYIKNLL